MRWPFKHNWLASYQVTYSYLTNIVTSYSGKEQRIAKRGEPRRSVQTRVTLDSDDARTFDRFLWVAGADPFDFDDPVRPRTSSVRLQDSVTVDHATSGVSSADITLAVEPGTDTYGEPDVDYGNSYQGRLVFPFSINWKSGVPDALSFPRRTIDFDSGRIAVDRPVAFNTRATTVSLLRAGLDEVSRLLDFFGLMRGRQGEFYAVSVLDDFRVVAETVSTTVQVAGLVADMFDSVNCGIVIELKNGLRFYRLVTTAAESGGTTLLSVDQPFNDSVSPATVRRCAWMRVARFASDDLTIEWITSTVAQSQVQVQTLEYALSETAFAFDDLTEYLVDVYGWGNFLLGADPMDYAVNVQIPGLRDDVTPGFAYPNTVAGQTVFIDNQWRLRV